MAIHLLGHMVPVTWCLSLCDKGALNQGVLFVLIVNMGS